MQLKSSRLLIVAALLLLLSGCDTALTFGSKTVGILSGAFFYKDGYLQANYNSSFDKVYTACEKTLIGMNATDITFVRKISHGDFMAMLQDERIRINVDYLEKGITSVSVMVGTSGSRIAAQLIHARIEETLKMR
jgi:hypothetical protein